MLLPFLLLPPPLTRRLPGDLIGPAVVIGQVLHLVLGSLLVQGRVTGSLGGGTGFGVGVDGLPVQQEVVPCHEIFHNHVFFELAPVAGEHDAVVRRVLGGVPRGLAVDHAIGPHQHVVALLHVVEEVEVGGELGGGVQQVTLEDLLRVVGDQVLTLGSELDSGQVVVLSHNTKSNRNSKHDKGKVTVWLSRSAHKKDAHVNK